ncbi:host specificity factor TipJ family phage tail protein [Pseudomonas sp.]|uniref:host specificity factor TipJ family phage tail protein n=1 Tax=Pseudomonas sp. TaxID=306 RepID=UPI003F2FD98D
MFSATCVTVRDPFHPLRHREVAELTAPAPIRSLAPATDKPFIILRNGEAVLRADWDQPINNADLLAVVLLPQGGDGGSDVMRVILMIVVAVVSIYTGMPVASGGLGWGAAAQAAVGIVGAALVNAMLPPPSAAGSNMGGGQAASPTYNIAAQGNQARLESPIPIQYGRMISFPDFAAAPYVAYAGNEQYLYQLFCLGIGEYEIEQIRIEDTPIGNFEEVECQIVPPGGVLTLFPAAVATAVEVSGQEALTGVPIGPFTANAAGSLAGRLAVDVVCPRGLYFATDEGTLLAKSITFQVEARAINDLGAPTTGWLLLGSRQVSAATGTPQRFSYEFTVAPGRYEVRLTRLDAKDSSTRAGHELSWAGLRAFIDGNHDFGDVTLVAIKMRATNNLSQQASRKINIISTRKLYTWTGAAWAGPVATRSIAWAFADACRHVGLPENRLDLDGLLALDAVWTARGDTFNARFDSLSTFWEVTEQIARAGRAKRYMQGGIVCLVRDQAATLPVALYSMRNIKRGSFNLEFLTPTADTADAVRITYFDSSLWKPLPLTAKLPDSTASRPAKIELLGVTEREQAYREGIYMAAANRYRRTLIRFETEMEGFIPTYGDLVAINHDLPQWGQHGEVEVWDAATRTLTLSEPLTWAEEGTHYLGLRRRDGSLAGPYVVTPGATAHKVMLAEPPDFTPYAGQDEERTHTTFGWGETWRQLARVISIRPTDTCRVALVCVNEDPSVHTAEDGITAPPVNASQLPATPSAPAVLGLSARSMPGAPERMLLTWQPAPGAEYYIVEQSADESAWTRSGETRAANFTAMALYGSQTIVRVAAVGQLRGSWATINYALEADYMWSSDANTPMWTDDSNLMWRY